MNTEEKIWEMGYERGKEQGRKETAKAIFDDIEKNYAKWGKFGDDWKKLKERWLK